MTITIICFLEWQEVAFISLWERLLKGNFEKYKGITAKTENVVF
jgi:hypothetical protein